MASEQNPSSSSLPESQHYYVSPESQGLEEQARLLSEDQELQEEEEEEETASAEERLMIENARALLGMGPSRIRKQTQEATPSPIQHGFLAHVGKALLSAPLYPMTLVQVLIQLGYEPIPPQRRYSIVFRQYMYYHPGMFGYAKAIVQQDGWKALYRGVGGFIVEGIVALTAEGVIAPIVAKGVDRLPLSVVEGGADVPDTEENVETTRAVVIRATRLFLRGILTQSAVHLISHPFRVIYVRSIAQYIGREQIYTSVWQSMKEIYREEGISGFYSGIIPTLLGCVYSTAMYVTLWSFFELLAMNAPHQLIKVLIKGLIEIPLLSYIPRTYSYPFNLMSNVMAVNNCRLAAGVPPRIPVLNGWLDCYHHLRSFRLLYRGSVVIFPRFAYKDLPTPL